MIRINIEKHSPWLYVVWLFVTWSFYVAFFYPLLQTDTSVKDKLIHESIRLLLFIAPIFGLIYLTRVYKCFSFGFFVFSLKTIGLGLLIGVLYMAGLLIVGTTLQGLRIELPETWKVVFIGFSVATIVEELTFRSYFLQVFSNKGKIYSIAMSSCLFVAIHYPGWILLGMHQNFVAWVTTSLGILILGCIAGVLFLKTRSIWPGVIVHACHNIGSALIK